MTPPTQSPDALLSQAGWVRSLALRLVRDPELADDLAQETYLAALRHRPDEGRSLRGWLATVLRNLVRQEARGISRRTDRERSVSRDDETGSTLDLVERLALHKQVVEAATGLNEPYRETILLRYFEECTPSEIALRTGVPLATVKTRLSRGLDRLRERLDREHDGDRGVWSVALLALAQPPGGTAYAGAARTAVGAAIVSTQLKFAAAAVLAAAGLYVVWPSDTDVQELDQSSITAAAPEMEPLEVDPAPALNTADSNGERVGLGAEAEFQAGAVDPVAIAYRAPAAPAPLEGLVLDSEGVPAAGVPLRLQPPGGYRKTSTDPDDESVQRTRSGSDGRFRFEAVVSGTVVAEGDEWVTVLSGLGAISRKRARPVVVVAHRRALAGRVIDAQGYAIEGARVRTSLPRGFRGRFHEIMDFSDAVENSVLTDADGHFELPDTPGVTESTLMASKVGFRRHSEPLPEHSDFALVLVLERQTALSGGILAGKVVDARGRPVPEARVAFGLDATLTDEYGIFRFEVNAEDSMNGRIASFMDGYRPARLLAMKEGLLPTRMDAVPSAEDDMLVWPDDIVMVLRGEPLSISGRVVNLAGEARPGVRVWVAESTVFSMDDQGGVVVESFLAGRQGARWTFELTDTEGRFEIRGLTDRAYTLVAMDTATLYREELADVDAGRSGVELVMHDDKLWPRVSGRVVARDGKGVSGVYISPQTDAKRLRYAGQVISTSHSRADGVTTDEDGSFVLERVPRDLVYLRLDGEDILSHEYGRGDRNLGDLAGEGIEDLRIVVGLRVHLQVTLADPALATGLIVLDAEGERVEINVIQGNSRNEGFDASIEGGRTDVLTVPDSAATLVLLRDGEEVARQELNLVRGDVLQVRF